MLHSVPLNANTSKGKAELKNSKFILYPVADVELERLPNLCSFIFNRHLLIISHLPGTVLRAGDTVLGIRQLLFHKCYLNEKKLCFLSRNRLM